jgi:hypothetical protein
MKMKQKEWRHDDYTESERRLMGCDRRMFLRFAGAGLSAIALTGTLIGENRTAPPAGRRTY